MPLRSRGRQFLRLLFPVMLVLSAFGAAAQNDAELEHGRQLFLEEAEPPCGICHRLADAGSEGAVGPDLNQLRPTKERVREAMKSGPGAMPVYDSLTDEQIEAVAEYVSAVAGQQN